MVRFSDILESNSALQKSRDLTAVFVGATNGIGLGALRAFAKHTSGKSPTIYIVGRSQRSLDKLSASIAELNPSAKIVPVQAEDLTLIKNAATAASVISQSAKKIDLLIMSPGYIALKREESPEGLDRVQAIRFYSRMQFLVTLAPLLRASPSPRVVTVLGGGKEGQLWPEDWTLRDHYNIPSAAGASGSLTTLYLEEFAKQPGNGNISLVHLFPGIVGGTGLVIKGLPVWGQFLVDWVASPLMKFFGYTGEEAGERVLYAATSGKFQRIEGKADEYKGKVELGSDGNIGSGIYLVQGDSTVVTERGNKVLKRYHEDRMGEKVWKHTMGEFEKIQ